MKEYPRRVRISHNGGYEGVTPCTLFTANRQAVASNGLHSIISWKTEFFNKSSCLWTPTSHLLIHENWIVRWRIKRVIQFMKFESSLSYCISAHIYTLHFCKLHFNIVNLSSCTYINLTCHFILSDENVSVC